MFFLRLVMGMLFETDFAVVVFCANCGRTHMEKISYFYLGRSLIKHITCVCGKCLGKIMPCGSGSYRMIFDEKNGSSCSFYFDRRILNENRVMPISSSEHSSETGFLGSLRAVYKELRLAEKYSQFSCTGLGNADTIVNPKVMFEVINKVDSLAMSGSIRCGECGHNRPSLEIFDSFIMLYCEKCGNIYRIRAEDKEDMKHIEKLEFIELDENISKSNLGGEKI